MFAADHYILGSNVLHKRFYASTVILAQFVSAAPKSISLLQLEVQTKFSLIDILEISCNLVRAGIIAPHKHSYQSWMLMPDVKALTLHDVYSCVLETQSQDTASRKMPIRSIRLERKSHQTIDIVITQAVMELNQKTAQVLRKFPVDRLCFAADESRLYI